MTWNRWYAFKSYLRSSLWIVPFIALLLEQVTFRIVYALDAKITWIPAWPLSLSGTQSALQTIITLMLSFIVFTFGSLLVAIQVASGQLTPRIIATTLLVTTSFVSPWGCSFLHCCLPSEQWRASRRPFLISLCGSRRS
jgi:uncharacterized membrane protein